MHTHHRGEAIYTAEVDVHFPMLTVGETLTFAARARAPRELPPGVSRTAYANHLRDVIMAMFGISHTINTRVGNEYVRGSVLQRYIPHTLPLPNKPMSWIIPCIYTGTLASGQELKVFRSTC